MAENEIVTADQTTEEGGVAVADGGEFQYPVTVEDAGPATKKVSVQIPEDRIKARLSKQFKEIRRDAQLPGFRAGRAPAKLIEKKFGSEIKEQVRRDLMRESYEQAVEVNKLAVLGEPTFDAGSNITLPEAGPLNYAFEVEVQPEFTLPSLTGIPVKRPKVEVREENVEQAMQNLREQQGTLVPVEDGAVAWTATWSATCTTRSWSRGRRGLAGSRCRTSSSRSSGPRSARRGRSTSRVRSPTPTRPSAARTWGSTSR
jgi:hypothetical protein